MGYKKPPLLARLFAKRLFRPLYYKYFDSWENDPLPPLPEQYKPYEDPRHHIPVLRPWLFKYKVFFKSVKKLRKKNKDVFSSTLRTKKQTKAKFLKTAVS